MLYGLASTPIPAVFVPAHEVEGGLAPLLSPSPTTASSVSTGGAVTGGCMLRPGAQSFDSSARRALFLSPSSPHAGAANEAGALGSGNCLPPQSPGGMLSQHLWASPHGPPPGTPPSIHSPMMYQQARPSSPFSSPYTPPSYSPQHHQPQSPHPGGRGGSEHMYNVYDMKSLASALATVQAGSGEIRRIFSACTFRPRLPGLTKLVSQLTREGNWMKGLEVFETLSTLGVRPDTTITNAAISACDKGGQWEKAMQVFNAMDQWGLPRDAITYSAAISSLSKGRQWSLAIDLFNHMSNANIECDAVTCCSLITALDKGGQWQLAEQVFVQMYQDHPQFKTLLQCMSAEGRGAGGTGPTSGAGQQQQQQQQQQHPVLAAASVSPAEAMLAMLRSPRVLEAFGEVDVLVEQEQQQQRQQQEVGGPPSTGSYTSFKTRETGGAQKTPTAEHGPGTDATTPKRMGAQGREPGAPAGTCKPPVSAAAAAEAATAGAAAGRGGTVLGPLSPATPKTGHGMATANICSPTGTKGGGLYRSYSAFPKIDEDLPAMHEPDEMIMRGPMLGGASVWVSPGADAGFATDLSASSTNLPGSPMSMHASAAAAGVAGAQPADVSKGGGSAGTGLCRHASWSEVAGGDGTPLPPGTPTAAAPGPLRLTPSRTRHASSSSCLLSMPSSGSMGSISPTQEASGLAGGAGFVGGGGGAGTSGLGSSVEDQLAELLRSMGHVQGPKTQDALNALLPERAATAHQAMESLGTLKQPQGMQTERGGGLVMPAASPMGSSFPSPTCAPSPYNQPIGSPYSQPPYSPYSHQPPSPYSANQQAHQPPYSPCHHPLYRTASAPSGANRGLLRTSSLNSKKSAPNRVCCNALLAAYARASPTQWRRAIRLLDLMWQCGGELCPDIVSYNTVIKACGNAAQIDMGFKVYHVMTMRGIEPTVATFGTLVCIAADAQATAHVKCAWQWLCASGLEVHITCANAYLQALLREGEWPEAQALFNFMCSPHGPCRPNAVTFSALISFCLARGDMVTVRQLYNKQLECGVQPSGSTIAMLINAFSAKGLWKDALGLLTAMCRPESCSRPAPGTFVTVFQALRDQALCVTDAAGRNELGRIMGTVRLLLKSQPQTHPDPALFSSMIAAFEAAALPDVCVELFNNLLACGLPIDCDMAESTLAAVVKQRAWGRAVQLVRAMLEYQSHNPPLGAGMCAGVLLAMANHQEWAHAYEVIKALYAASRTACFPTLHRAGSSSRNQNASIMSSLLGVGKVGSEDSPGEEGTSCLSDLVDVLQAEKHTDLLLLVVIAEKEVSQHWGDAAATFRWVMQQGSSVLASSRLGHALFYELLFLHAGVDGLRESVLLCKTAHEMGVLHSFPLPRHTQISDAQSSPAANATAMVTCTRSASAKVLGSKKQDITLQLPKAGGSASRLEQMSGAGSSETFQAGMSLRGLSTGEGLRNLGTEIESAEGGYEVLIEGDSHIYAIVTLLAWMLTMRDKAREGVRVPCPHITIRLAPSTVEDPNSVAPPSPSRLSASMPPHALRQLLGPGFSHLSDSQIAELEGGMAPLPPPESSMLAQLRAAAVLVLDGSYTLHLGMLGQPSQDVFVLRPPGVPFEDAEGRVLRLSTHSLYAALGIV